MKKHPNEPHWKKLDGTDLGTVDPRNLLFADESGPTDRFTLDDELGTYTWLNSMLYNNGRLHLAYNTAYTNPQREHYIHVDCRSGHRVDNWPSFKAQSFSIHSVDAGGFFAGHRLEGDNRLYFVSNDRERGLVCLRSEDNGSTWLDHAANPGGKQFTGKEIGGCRRVTDDGSIIGLMQCLDKSMPTGQQHVPGVFFFRIPV
jgi:hypothetical protein